MSLTREAIPFLYFCSCQSYPLQFGAHILPWLKCVDIIVEFIPMSYPDQVWYLIVSFPDLCRLSYFNFLKSVSLY